MICKYCGGPVTWRGPFSALTHTECSSCGATNCQRPEPSEDEEEEIDWNDNVRPIEPQ
jgi:hypothetical protein